jgi:cytochrome b6-f complex iron-sulfur subunit
MRRRSFLINGLGASVALAFPLAFLGCSKDDEEESKLQPGDELLINLDDPSSSNLNTVGGYIYSGNIIVARVGQEEYVALSKICTHQGCTIQYSSSSGNFPCPCHGSVFSPLGSVVNGPAPSPVEKFNVVLDNRQLKISV